MKDRQQRSHRTRHKSNNPTRKQPKATQQVDIQLPQGECIATITELLTDGRGLAHVNGKAVMITGALPDEVVNFRYTGLKKNTYQGEISQIVTASSDRVMPKCIVFQECGGCVLQHLDSEKQIAIKHQQLFGNLKKLLGKPGKKVDKSLAPPLTANHWGYRHRARVGLKWQKDSQRVDVGFRGRASSHIVPTNRCEVLVPALSNLLSPIADLVAKLSSPDHFTHVEMTQGVAVVAVGKAVDSPKKPMLTFRHVVPLNTSDEKLFKQFAEHYSVDIFLQGGQGADELMGVNNESPTTYHIDLSTENDQKLGCIHNNLRMDFMPYHFTQVNFTMNQKMLHQALNWLDLQANDCVLDLFCGLGNFTLPIAQRVQQVVGVEGSKSLVDWAKQNADNNGINNVKFYQADLTKDTRMMAWRVKYQYNKLLIDPPRAGAIDIMPLIQEIKPEMICYVSCHAATLARDLQHLIDAGYRLAKVGAMDMFPQTAHVEAMALLKRP